MIHVGVQHAQRGIIALYVLLDDEVPFVLRAVDTAQDVPEFLLFIDDEDLLLPFERGLPVGDTVAWLYDYGEVEGQLYVLVYFPGADKGLGVVQAVLFAGLVEVLLDDELVHHLFADVGDDEVLFKLRLVLHYEPCVDVTAGYEYELGFAVLFPDLCEGAEEDFFAFYIAVLVYLQKLRVASLPVAGFADGYAFNVVLQIKANGHAVNVPVAAEQYGYEFLRCEIQSFDHLFKPLSYLSYFGAV